MSMIGHSTSSIDTSIVLDVDESTINMSALLDAYYTVRI